MKEIMSGPHPDFDALSAFADLDAVGAARSRVGRHVARCEACRTEVAEIRALGDAARAVAIEGAGTELWERIRVAAASDDAVAGRVSKSDRLVSVPTHADGVAFHEPAHAPSSGRGARAWGLGGAFVLALVGMAVWATRSSLDAGAASRLTFTPSRPVPGGTMTVRYRPASWFAGAPKLVLAGRFVKRESTDGNRYVVEARDGVDSLATLVPASDGSFEARMQLPDDFLGVRMMVLDATGDASDRDGDDMWIAIGGRRDHSPSLDAFIASYSPASRRARSRQPVAVADSIQRYFPGHPAGWSLYDRYGQIRGVLDLFRFFESAEKKYASLDEMLWPKRTLDAEQSWAMVSLARKVSEPAEEAKWAQRLAREHPDDPRAFRALAGVVHEIELRDPPHVADSIRPWLPVLDSLYLRSRPVLDPYSNDMLLFKRQGDSVQKEEWSRRFERPSAYFTRGELPRVPDLDREEELRSRIAAGCAKPSGKFPLPDVSAWTRWCAYDHMLLWNYLAEAHLSRGDAPVAEALADSAMATVAGRCADREAFRIRGDARLARGDTVGAGRDYAMAYGRWTQDTETRARAASRLGAHFDAASFDTLADSARRETLGCLRRQKVADSTHAARHLNP